MATTAPRAEGAAPPLVVIDPGALVDFTATPYTEPVLGPVPGPSLASAQTPDPAPPAPTRTGKRQQRAAAAPNVATTTALRDALDTLAAAQDGGAAQPRVSGNAYLADTLSRSGVLPGASTGAASLTHSMTTLGGAGAGFGTQPTQMVVDDVLERPIECLGTMEGVLVVKEEEIAALLQDEIVCSQMSLELAYCNELKRHRVRREDMQRVRAILVSAFRRHHTVVMLQEAPLEDLTICSTAAADTFKAGDAVPRPGSKTWHLMRWLTLDEHVRCFLGRRSATTFVGQSRYTYYLVANATSFATSAGSPTEAAMREAADARAATADAERLLAATRDANAVLAAEADAQARALADAKRENELLRARLAEIMRAHERLKDRAAVLEQECDRRDALLRDIFLLQHKPAPAAPAAAAAEASLLFMAAPAASVVPTTTSSP